MDPVALIVAALVAGVSAGLGDTAKAAVKDAYDGLRSSLSRRFGSARAEQIVQDHAEDPDTFAKPMEKLLRDSGAAEDDEVLAAARKVLERSDPAGTAAGKYTTVNASGSTIGIIGDHGSVTYSAVPPVVPGDSR